VRNKLLALDNLKGLNAKCDENIKTTHFYLGRDVMFTCDHADVEAVEFNPVCDENKIVYHYPNNNPITFTCGFFAVDMRHIDACPNNKRKMNKQPMMAWRKLYKLNPKKYALTIYNMQSQYDQNKCSFDEWVRKKRIEM
jgi:hypothetical protein